MKLKKIAYVLAVGTGLSLYGGFISNHSNSTAYASTDKDDESTKGLLKSLSYSGGKWYYNFNGNRATLTFHKNGNFFFRNKSGKLIEDGTLSDVTNTSFKKSIVRFKISNDDVNKYMFLDTNTKIKLVHSFGSKKYLYGISMYLTDKAKPSTLHLINFLSGNVQHY